MEYAIVKVNVTDRTIQFIGQPSFDEFSLVEEAKRLGDEYCVVSLYNPIGLLGQMVEFND